MATHVADPQLQLHSFFLFLFPLILFFLFPTSKSAPINSNSTGSSQLSKLRWHFYRVIDKTALDAIPYDSIRSRCLALENGYQHLLGVHTDPINKSIEERLILGNQLPVEINQLLMNKTPAERLSRLVTPSFRIKNVCFWHLLLLSAVSVRSQEIKKKLNSAISIVCFPINLYKCLRKPFLQPLATDIPSIYQLQH